MQLRCDIHILCAATSTWLKCMVEVRGNVLISVKSEQCQQIGRILLNSEEIGRKLQKYGVGAAIHTIEYISIYAITYQSTFTLVYISTYTKVPSYIH